jgi:hypothetical protein
MSDEINIRKFYNNPFNNGKKFFKNKELWKKKLSKSLKESWKKKKELEGVKK